MLSSGGEVKVADFGLARIGREGQSLDLTQIGMNPGNPAVHEPRTDRGPSGRHAERHLFA